VPGKKLTWAPNGRCVEHMRANNKSCEWTSCTNFLSGCQQLSRKFGTWKCYACFQGYLPCSNALKGCPRHVTTPAL
jgi:hypothetical protein